VRSHVEVVLKLIKHLDEVDAERVPMVRAFNQRARTGANSRTIIVVTLLVSRREGVLVVRYTEHAEHRGEGKTRREER
jgi:hypothetical protein